jgi:hypothetical protein
MLSTCTVILYIFPEELKDLIYPLVSNTGQPNDVALGMQLLFGSVVTYVIIIIIIIYILFCCLFEMIIVILLPISLSLFCLENKVTLWKGRSFVY